MKIAEFIEAHAITPAGKNIFVGDTMCSRNEISLDITIPLRMSLLSDFEVDSALTDRPAREVRRFLYAKVKEHFTKLKRQQQGDKPLNVSHYLTSNGINSGKYLYCECPITDQTSVVDLETNKVVINNLSEKVFTRLRSFCDKDFFQDRFNYVRHEYVPLPETENSFITKDDDTVVNIYVGPDYEILEDVEISPATDYFLDYFTDGDENSRNIIERWMFDLTFARKTQTHLGFLGARGIGKSSFMGPLLTGLVGEQNTSTINGKQMVRGFSFPIRNVKLLRMSEPQKYSGRDGRAALTVELKDLLNEVVAFEQKRKDIISIDNYCNVVIDSNDFDAIDFLPDERGFTLPDITEHSMILAPEKWAALRGKDKRDSLRRKLSTKKAAQNLASYLFHKYKGESHRLESGFWQNVSPNYPMTRTLKRAIIGSRFDVDVWILSYLNTRAQFDSNGHVSFAELVDDYRRIDKSFNKRNWPNFIPILKSFNTHVEKIFEIDEQNKTLKMIKYVDYIDTLKFEDGPF